MRPRHPPSGPADYCVRWKHPASTLATAREREALLRERVDALESEIARIRADADAATAERNDAESARDVSAERLRTANRAAARLTGPS